MKSKFIYFFSVIILSLLTFLSNISAKERNVSIYLDGNKINPDQEPIISEGTTYVPMRFVFEAFGFDIDWNQEKKRIKAKNAENNYIMILQVGSTKVNICGNDTELDKCPLIINNRVLIPVRALSEKLNAEVIWDSKNESVIINRSAEPIMVSTARDFNYQNCESDNFWSDNTWEENTKSLYNETNQAYALYDLYELYDDDDYNDYFRKEHNRHHKFEDNKYKDFYYKDSEDDLKDKVSEIDRNGYEKEVLELVNEERKKENLEPLKWNEELAKIARNHSKDMIERNFFEHTNPDGKSPFDRYAANGIKYSFAAENIAAGNKTPKDVVNSWMNSEGHKANILNPDLKELGVGLAFGGEYGYYWTQCFIG